MPSNHISVTRLTRDQATAITAYTGITVMSFSDFVEDVDKKFPGISTIGLAMLHDKIAHSYQPEYEDTIRSLNKDQLFHLSIAIGTKLYSAQEEPYFRDFVNQQTGYSCSAKIDLADLKRIKQAYGQPLLDALCYTDSASAGEKTSIAIGETVLKGISQKIS